MSSARSQRHEALGILCRRLLSPIALALAPLVLLVFLTLSVIASRPRTVSAASADRVDHLGHGRPRPASAPRRALAAAAALLTASLAAAALAGGTYAFLNSQATTPAITVSSGSLIVTVQAAGTTAGATTAIPAAAWTNMLPGDIVGQQVQVVNSGTSAAQLSFSLAAASAWDIRVNWGTCPTTQITNNSLTTTPVVGATVPAGFSSTMCVQALLPATAAANVESTSANASILIGVKQVAP